MPVVAGSYAFATGVSAFFEMPTSDARKLLPKHLEPLEMQHERSILALTCFEFTESEVGHYFEVVLAVIVPPMVEPGKPLPKAAFYPFYVGVTSAAAREHATERWHLPHFMGELDIAMNEFDDRMEVEVPSTQGAQVRIAIRVLSIFWAANDRTPPDSGSDGPKGRKRRRRQGTTATNTTNGTAGAQHPGRS